MRRDTEKNGHQEWRIAIPALISVASQGHYGSARQDWRSQEQHRDWRRAPRGASVFYDTSADAHVALSLGDGRVVSSSAHGRVGIVPIDHFRRPLGWASAPD